MTDEPVAYIDSNLFIYAFEGAPQLATPAQTLLKAFRNRPGSAITSELTLAEVLAPSNDGRKRHPDLQRQYLDLIIRSEVIALHPVSREALLETVRLRSTKATGKLKIPDAIHMATALLTGCRFFVSDDMKIPVPTHMQRVKSDAKAIAGLIKALEQ